MNTAYTVNKKTLSKRPELALESGVEMKPKLSLKQSFEYVTEIDDIKLFRKRK
jgi:hypothetical protein